MSRAGKSLTIEAVSCPLGAVLMYICAKTWKTGTSEVTTGGGHNTMSYHSGRRDVISNWQDKHAALFGRHTVGLQHGLHLTDLFTDDALAELIETTPRDAYHVNTMNPEAHEQNSWREGELGPCSGHDVLRAVREGTIWILIQKLGSHPVYGRVLNEIYDEFETRMPGSRFFRRSMSCLISSPRVQVYYHCDIPGQMLWQMRGKKRVYVYPNTEPFLTRPAMERIVLGEADEQETPYHAWFDDYAEAMDLEPGMMAHWPLNGPHRVENADCLNVSLTTSHYTSEVRNSYAVNYANGVLRKLGLKPEYRLKGPAVLGKAALTALYKASGLHKMNAMKFNIDFRVDPESPGGFVDIPPYELGK